MAAALFLAGTDRTAALLLAANADVDRRANGRSTATFSVLDAAASWRPEPEDAVALWATYRTVSDGEITLSSTTLQSATAAFVAADVGAHIVAWSGGSIVYRSTVVSINSGTAVTMADAAESTASGLTLHIGTRIFSGLVWRSDERRRHPGTSGRRTQVSATDNYALLERHTLGAESRSSEDLYTRLTWLVSYVTDHSLELRWTTLDSYLLLETGDDLLLETGDRLVISVLNGPSLDAKNYTAGTTLRDAIEEACTEAGFYWRLNVLDQIEPYEIDIDSPDTPVTLAVASGNIIDISVERSVDLDDEGQAYRVSVVTDTVGFEPGQVGTITDAAHDVSGDHLIESVRYSLLAANPVVWRSQITALPTIATATDWLDYWRALVA